MNAMTFGRSAASLTVRINGSTAMRLRISNQQARDLIRAVRKTRDDAEVFSAGPMTDADVLDIVIASMYRTWDETDPESLDLVSLDGSDDDARSVVRHNIEVRKAALGLTHLDLAEMAGVGRAAWSLIMSRGNLSSLVLRAATLLVVPEMTLRARTTTAVGRMPPPPDGWREKVTRVVQDGGWKNPPPYAELIDMVYDS